MDYLKELLQRHADDYAAYLQAQARDEDIDTLIELGQDLRDLEYDITSWAKSTFGIKAKL